MKPKAIPVAGKAQRAGLAFVFLWFVIGGIAHFALTETEMRIEPPRVPWPRAAVLVSGVFELLGAAGLLWRPVQRWALWGLSILTVAVTPAHIFMLQQPELFPGVPYWALVAGRERWLKRSCPAWSWDQAGADLVPEEISALRAWEAEASASLRHGI